MFPSCLPLLFNAKVLAKDTFLLLLHYSILLCTVASSLPHFWALAWPGRLV